MTEQVQEFAEGQSAPSVSESVAPSAPVQPARTFTQADLDRVAGKVREDAYQKGLRDAANRHQQHVESQPISQPNVTQPISQPVQHVGGIPQLSDDQIRQKIIEETQRLKQFENYTNVANSFVSKVEASKSKYEDFDKVATDLKLHQVPIIWQTAEKFDNPADIVYHLGKNPGKLAQLLTVAYSPELVERGMHEISDSIKQNELASEQKQPNAPLSRPTPSNLGTGNGGNKGQLTAQDWKKILRT